MTVLELQSCIDHLNKRHGIAVSAILLITEWPCKIIVLNVSEVIALRNEILWDVFGLLVIFPPGLSVLHSFSESIGLFTELLLAALWAFLIDSLDRWKTLHKATTAFYARSCFTKTFELWVHLAQFEILVLRLDEMEV